MRRQKIEILNLKPMSYPNLDQRRNFMMDLNDVRNIVLPTRTPNSVYRNTVAKDSNSNRNNIFENRKSNTTAGVKMENPS